MRLQVISWSLFYSSAPMRIISLSKLSIIDFVHSCNVCLLSIVSLQYGLYKFAQQCMKAVGFFQFGNLYIVLMYHCSTKLYSVPRYFKFDYLTTKFVQVWTAMIPWRPSAFPCLVILTLYHYSKKHLPLSCEFDYFTTKFVQVCAAVIPWRLSAFPSQSGSL